MKDENGKEMKYWGEKPSGNTSEPEPDVSAGKSRKQEYFFTESGGFVAGFYSKTVGAVPAEAKPISDADRQKALEAQSKGYALSVKGGKIVPVEQVADPLEQARGYVKSELAAADVQVRYHEDEDNRAIGTEIQWREYRKALRDYVKAGKVEVKKPKTPA